MGYRASTVTVGTSPTSLVVGTDDDSLAGLSLIVKNTGSAEIRLGGPGVTLAAGFPLAPGDQLATDSQTGTPLYAVTASGTNVVNVLLVNV